MKPLAGHRVAVLGGMKDRPLVRYLVSLGAEAGGPLEGASFVVDDLGLESCTGLPIPENAIHVSVTTFGSGGPRSRCVAISCATREDREIANFLQNTGIAAGALQDCEAVMQNDPQIAGRQALVTLDHAVLGPFGHVVTPMAFSRDVLEPFRPPSMGKHNYDVARRICGLSDPAIDELDEQGVFH